MSDNQSENSDQWSSTGRSALESLPPLETLQAEQVMAIRQVIVTDYGHSHKVLRINTINQDGTSSLFDGPVYKIINSNVQGLLPSKCWINDGEDKLEVSMTFYTCTSLPDRARPFGDGPTYVIIMFPPPRSVVEYPVDLRMFIDHIITNRNQCAYVFCFGQNVYDQLLIGNSE